MQYKTSLYWQQDNIKAKNLLAFKKRLYSYETARIVAIILNGKNIFCQSYEREPQVSEHDPTCSKSGNEENPKFLESYRTLFTVDTKEQAVFDPSPTDTPDTTQLIQGQKNVCILCMLQRPVSLALCYTVFSAAAQ